MPAATGAAVAVHEQEQGQDQHRPSRTTPPNRPDRQGFSVDGRGVARVGPCSLTGRARRLARDLGGELARAAGEVAGAERLQVLAHGRGLVGKGGQHAVDLGQQRAQCEPQHAADQAPGHHEHERGRDQPRDAKGRRSQRRVGDTRHPRPTIWSPFAPSPCVVPRPVTSGSVSRAPQQLPRVGAAERSRIAPSRCRAVASDPASHARRLPPTLVRWKPAAARLHCISADATR